MAFNVRKVMNIDAELEKHQFEGLEMRDLNETEKFTSQALYRPCCLVDRLVVRSRPRTEN